jgi:hypothetical protein
MYWFGSYKIDITIINPNNNNTDVKLFELCNQCYNNGTIFVDKITICDSIQVLVPPLEFLYAIKNVFCEDYLFPKAFSASILHYPPSAFGLNSTTG